MTVKSYWKQHGINISEILWGSRLSPRMCRKYRETPARAIARQRRQLPKSGHRHIYVIKEGHWRIEFQRNNKKIRLGSFTNLDKAISARDEYLQSCE